jgi:alanyl-tRNA synthetase
VRVSKTEKLYLDDPYTTEFRAKVVAAEPLEGGGHLVLLEQSYFYPDSGGQTSDRGRMDGLDVIDVQEGEGESVLHTVAGDVAPSAEVECVIDWDRRFDHMQQHTGQHVLSRAFIETGGLHTVSFHMGDDTCTIDVEGGAFTDEAVAGAEALANRVIEENRRVVVRTVAVDELEAMGLRGKVPEGVHEAGQEARLVEVDGFDVVPCCGTHVRTTGELGVVKVLKHEKVKGTQRVYFKAGRRALADYACKHAIVTELANRFTTGTSEVGAKVDKVVAESQSHKKTVKMLSQKLAALEKSELLDAAEDVGGVRFVARVVEGDGSYARMLSSGLKSEPKTVAILGAADGTVIVSASDDVGVDVAGLAVPRAKELGGSGGGKGSFAQVKLPDGVSVAEFIEGIGSDVRSSL